jgi:hypothetical protein
MNRKQQHGYEQKLQHWQSLENSNMAMSRKQQHGYE